MRCIAAGLMSITVLAATAACTSSPAPDDPPSRSSAPITVTIGVPPFLEAAPVYLGLREGFFSKRGIQLDIRSDENIGQLALGTATGEIQFCYYDAEEVISEEFAKGFEIRTGSGIKVVANGASSTGEDGADYSAVMVADDSPIQSAKDLTGKELRVDETGDIGDVTLRESIRAAGGDPSGIEAFSTLNYSSWKSVADGNYDAAVVVEPWLTWGEKEGEIRAVASNLVDTAPDLPVGLYFTTQTFAQANPDLVTAFTEAMNESLAYADAHPGEVRSIIGTYVEDIEYFDDSTIFEEMTLPRWPTEINRSALERLAALSLQYGLMDQPADLDTLLP